MCMQISIPTTQPWHQQNFMYECTGAGETFLANARYIPRNAVYVWTLTQKRCHFENMDILVDGPFKYFVLILPSLYEDRFQSNKIYYIRGCDDMEFFKS